MLWLSHIPPSNSPKYFAWELEEFSNLVEHGRLQAYPLKYAINYSTNEVSVITV
jgi:hypothetical protein